MVQSHAYYGWGLQPPGIIHITMVGKTYYNGYNNGY